MTPTLSPADRAADPAPGTDPAEAPRPGGRSDGEASRQRLLRAGLRLFARQGYAATSTRELAQAAGMNIAAIAYYFGDKAGLYRAAFFEPLGDPQVDLGACTGPALDLADALRCLLRALLAPLAQGEDMRLCVKLRMREMLEPTGLWEQELAQGIRPMHEALCSVLSRHLGLAAPDDQVQRLAVCIAGLGVHLHVGRDVIDAVAPQLNQGPHAAQAWTEFLVQQALAMVAHDQQRRATPASTPTPSPA
jgi:AcrR family transcriptional regulator